MAERDAPAERILRLAAYAHRVGRPIALGDIVDDVPGYEHVGDKLVFPHTEIERPLRGQGFGDQLIKGALDDVRRAGRTLVPSCWAVAEYIAEHPEYADLVAGYPARSARQSAG